MSKFSKRLAAAALPIALLAAMPAFAACTATISTAPATLNYDPIKAVAATSTTLTVSISKNANSDDAFRLIFTDSATGTLKVGTAGPLYSITNANGQTVSFANGATAAGQTGVNTVPLAPGNATTSATFTLSLPVNTTTDFVGGIGYTENLGYSLQCFKNNVLQASASGSITSATANITNVLSVVTASPQTINFGNFTTTSQTLQVGLKSTNSIDVAVSTLNGSKMTLAGATAPFLPSNSVPYTMTFNGTALSSSAVNNVARASVTGNTYPFVLSLTGGVPTGKLAGVYADVITLTFTPGI